MRDLMNMHIAKTRSALICRFISVILTVSVFGALCSCSTNNSGFDGSKFSKKRHISVMTDSSDSNLERFIHDSVLRDCNIEVEFVSSYKFSQESGVVPDVAYSNRVNMLNTYYRMNSVINISPYLNDYGYAFPDLYNLLGDKYIYSCNDDPSEVWYLSPYSSEPEARITFIREDWLNKLGLDVPSNRIEFQECLVAFRDNSKMLLGDEADNLIPFFVDCEPNVSCKPLFDSFLDTDIDDETFFVNGYCRAIQDGYSDGLKTLNEWYHLGLLPDDFQTIRPGTKESYEAIECGYVGAFCSEYDYLYKNGLNSHINALHNNCGKEANYIAVNTFENNNHEYVSWEEDYLASKSNYIFFPSTCSDPLACLVYLNWISNSDHIAEICNVASSSLTANSYLLTLDKDNILNDDIYDYYFDLARQTASEVKVIHRGNKCVRYDTSVFLYVQSNVDLNTVYPKSTGIFTCSIIVSSVGNFEDTYNASFEEYLNSGTFFIHSIRQNEWDKVMVRGSMYPM